MKVLLILVLLGAVLLGHSRIQELPSNWEYVIEHTNCSLLHEIRSHVDEWDVHSLAEQYSLDEWRIRPFAYRLIDERLDSLDCGSES